MLATLHQRNFPLVWLGELISNIGKWVFWIALPFYVYESRAVVLPPVLASHSPGQLWIIYPAVFADGVIDLATVVKRQVGARRMNGG